MEGFAAYDRKRQYRRFDSHKIKVAFVKSNSNACFDSSAFAARLSLRGIWFYR